MWEVVHTWMDIEDCLKPMGMPSWMSFDCDPDDWAGDTPWKATFNILYCGNPYAPIEGIVDETMLSTITSEWLSEHFGPSTFRKATWYCNLIPWERYPCSNKPWYEDYYVDPNLDHAVLTFGFRKVSDATFFKLTWF